MVVAEPLQQRGAGALARVAHEPGGLSGGEIENLRAPPLEECVDEAPVEGELALVLSGVETRG